MMGKNGKPLIGERHQKYSNEAENYEKLAQERMYGGKGRKFVKERQGNEMRTNEHFKGIDHNSIGNFD